MAHNLIRTLRAKLRGWSQRQRLAQLTATIHRVNDEIAQDLALLLELRSQHNQLRGLIERQAREDGAAAVRREVRA
jgi:hypothetical protein